MCDSWPGHVPHLLPTVQYGARQSVASLEVKQPPNRSEQIWTAWESQGTAKGHQEDWPRISRNQSRFRPCTLGHD